VHVHEQTHTFIHKHKHTDTWNYTYIRKRHRLEHSHTHERSQTRKSHEHTRTQTCIACTRILYTLKLRHIHIHTRFLRPSIFGAYVIKDVEERKSVSERDICVSMYIYVIITNFHGPRWVYKRAILKTSTTIKLYTLCQKRGNGVHVFF
jgi:predicted ABC-class ATPase